MIHNSIIEGVLQSTDTKSNKIVQLLRLGLTRRQVADLVTHGNYGFVYNVAKKHNLLTPMTTPSITTSNFSLDFTRNFGVEIEAYGCTRTQLLRELRKAGIVVEDERYNHTTRPYWKIVHDSSLQGENTFELVSPVLHGEEGLAELRKVCYVLEFLGAQVNSSCGLHVHLDAEDFDLPTWKRLLRTALTLEPIIDRMMPASRRHNQYCCAMANISTQKINRATSVDQLREAFYKNRYYKVNVEAYARHRTIEFRQHSGTIEYTKISHWVRFLAGMINFAVAGHEVRAEEATLQTLPFITDDAKLFYTLRTRKFA